MKLINRKKVDENYLYIDIDPKNGNQQLIQRYKKINFKSNIPISIYPEWMVIAILTEIIKGSSIKITPNEIALRLQKSGINISSEHAREIISYYFKKKLNL